ncbi:MAG: hypothetical protein ACP5VE_11845 [Chthonomonadales bacterium]
MLLLALLSCVCVFGTLGWKPQSPGTSRDLSSAELWERPAWAGAPNLIAQQDGGFELVLPEGRQWAAVVHTEDVDLGHFPILTVDVSTLSEGASWVLKTDNQPYDPAHPRDVVPSPAGGDTPGLYLVDLRELGRWTGRQSIELRLFVVGKPGARVTFRRVVLTEAAGSRRGASALLPRPDEMRAPCGPWLVSFRPLEGRLTVALPGAAGGVAVDLPHGDELLSRREEGMAGSTLWEAATATDWGRFQTIIRVTQRPHPMLRWTVEAVWRAPHALEAAPPECRYVSLENSRRLRLYVLSGHRFGQQGFETGHAFLPCDPLLGGTALYVQNLTALNPWFQATHTSAKEVVKAGAGGFGYARTASGKELPASTRLVLTDAWLSLSPDAAPDPVGQARAYLDLLAEIYTDMEHPPTEWTDWRALASQTLDVLQTPACAANPEEGRLRNYVNEPWDPHAAELMVQLDPLVAGLLYQEIFGVHSQLTDRIIATLEEFYLPSIHCIRDWNRQDRITKADAWYVIFPLVQLARAAAMGSDPARKLVEASLPAAIALAHACNYRFPVFYNPETLSSFQYAEPDCAGAYAYLMLQARNLFGGGTYLEEARNALDALRTFGLDGAYELHLSALGAAACARMWKATGDASYLAWSAVPLGSLMRRCRLWDCRYGTFNNGGYFFGVSAMPGAYLAPFEQYHAWLALREFDAIAHEALPPSLRRLTAAFLRYTPTVIRHTLPPFMPADAVAKQNERHHPNDLRLPIPVEDVADGWEECGKIGQEIYGSGAAMALAAKMTYLVPGVPIKVVSEYPVTSATWDGAAGSLRIRFAGSGAEPGRVRVEFDTAATGWSDPARLRLKPTPPTNVQDVTAAPGSLTFLVPGEREITISPVR